MSIIDSLFDDYELGTKEFGRERTFDVPNNTLTVRQNGPYGFWTLHLKRGQLPAKYTGMYTSYSEAEKAVEDYKRYKTKE